MSASPSSIPATKSSGSVVSAADFDRDGDLDLFLGGRIIPGKYPKTANSSIFVNNGNLQFRDVTNQVAPEVINCGLVTSGIWTDVDGDSWLDLLVTQEWGPVKLFRNDKGILERGDRIRWTRAAHWVVE